MAYIQPYSNTELPQLTEQLFQFLFSIYHSMDQNRRTAKKAMQVQKWSMWISDPKGLKVFQIKLPFRPTFPSKS